MISDTSITAMWPWLKAKYGFEDSQIRKYTFNWRRSWSTQRGAGRLSHQRAYTVETQAHFKPQVFLLADNGYAIYSNLVLAPQKWIDKKPAAVQAFYDATRRLARILTATRGRQRTHQRDNPEMTEALIGQAIGKINPSASSNRRRKTFGIGAMTDRRWKSVCASSVAERLYAKTLACEKAYDLTFMRNAPQYFE